MAAHQHRSSSNRGGALATRIARVAAARTHDIARASNMCWLMRAWRRAVSLRSYAAWRAWRGMAAS